MDDILRKLRQKNKRDKNSSPLGDIFSDVAKEDPEDDPENEMEITHPDAKVRAEVVTGGEGLRGLDFQKEPEGSVDILGGDGIRELSAGDLTVSHPEADHAAPDPPGKATRATEQNDDEIVLKTQNSTKVKFLKLVVALLESGHYDQAIETIYELRRATEH